MAEYHGDIGWSTGSLYKGDDSRECIIALILWFFFGFIGVHRFYRSKPLTGLAQLSIFCLGVVFTGIFISFSIATVFAIVLGVWLLFDMAFLIGELINAG